MLHSLENAPLSVHELAPAKVNLLLSVGKKRRDGYHDLVSVMQTVGLYDRLTLTSDTGEGIELACRNSGLPTGKGNLAYDAAVKFFSCTGIENTGVRIDLEKQLPMQAGLGGGSADAAAVLRGLGRLYAPSLGTAALERMGAALGSDVPFCVRGGTALVLGRGEHVESLPPLPSCYFVLVKPPLAFSTGNMYGRIDSRGLCEATSGAEMTAALERGDLSAVCRLMDNTFERVIDPECEVFAIRRRLTELGALGAMLSGSGSAVFGIFKNEAPARLAADTLRAFYPETFCAPSV
ncbi:MAG: 4-(cytidine 5'-diphospho)-2-C-methyl-D-erythritol kinase [Oscillospiraceae bacterium]|nr:4-(cytidine 5'-diphospho)-2-C-methyl-D-erythritol kinase [Oscillospiraceae bacterium]